MLKVTGRVDHQTAPELEKALRAILDAGRRSIVVDLSDATYVSSAGIKVLQASAKAARAGVMPGDLRLAGLQPNLRELFNMLGLAEFFKIYDSAVDAVGSY
jgi:anti-sigma B factor antagonist